jgi:hypothetical protein
MNCAEMDLSPIIDDSKMNFYDTDLRTAYIEDDICDSEHDDLIAELQNGSKDTEELLYLLKNDKTINPDEKEEMLIAYNVELDPIDHNRPLSELLQEATSVAQDYNQNLQQEQSQDMNKDTIEY